MDFVNFANCFVFANPKNTKKSNTIMAKRF